MRTLDKIAAVAAGVGLAVTAVQAASAESAADRAVEAAKQFAAITLDITYEAGLQAMDPLNFSGPMWEELTGIKINVIELPLDEMFTKAFIEHRAGTGAYDVVSVVPALMADMVAAGVVEPLDPFIDKYGYRDELQDIAATYRDNWMTWDGTIYGPCLSGLHPHPLGLEWAQPGYRGARHGCSRPRRSPIPAFATRVQRR